MENASKALIIAGAILISILLIGLGVGVYQMAAGTTKNANLDKEAAQAQNSQFEATFGTNKSATEVKNLLSLIRTNNITGTEDEHLKTIYVAYGSDAPTKNTAAISAKMTPGNRYTVEVSNDDSYNEDEGDNAPANTGEPAYYNTGYIRMITITPTGKSKEP